MRLTNQIVSILKKILVGCLIVLILISFLELSFIGKNITFTTRLTPPQSEQNHLRNETYITEAQVLIIILCIAFCFLSPLLGYCSFKKPRKIFFPVLVSFAVVNVLLILLNLFFLLGASQYRSYMNIHYQNIVEANGICDSANTTICMVGTCNRLQIFKEAKDMAISFTVIDSLFSSVVIALSIMCNQKRKDADKLELIV